MSKPISYRLALDLGSTSLGWAIFRLNEQNERTKPTAILRAGVRIFSDGRHPKSGASLAVDRREARAMRRRRDRLLKRKKRMQDKLVQYGFFPAEKDKRQALELINPYALRAKGLREALTPGEFARALFHINQRRGFKSNRKTDKKNNESGALKKAISELRLKIEVSGSSTAGEYLWSRLQQGHGVRARYREAPYITEQGKKGIDKSYDLYIDRAMIEQEFDLLWAAQAAFDPELFNEMARVDLKDTLLHQRPLNPVKPGRCTLLPDEERAPLALPSNQNFRIYQEVNHLRMLDEQMDETALTLQQRDIVVAALQTNAKLSFAKIRKLLKLSKDVQFNLEDIKRAELKGNATSALLAKEELFGAAWLGFDAGLQDEIVWQLVNEGSEGALIAWLQDHTGVDEFRAQAILSAGLPEGYGRLSRKALARIVPALRAGVITYDKAVQVAGFEHHSQLGFAYDKDEVDEWVNSQTGEICPVFKQLPYYGKALQRHVAFAKENPKNEEERYGKIANPTVHIGLNQVRKVVNVLIRRYGRPREVVIELVRDLKQSAEQKKEDERRQADEQKRNTRIRKSISELEILGIGEEQVRKADIRKWIFWEELSSDVAERLCPYSGERISDAMLLGDQVEVEHIFPFSCTLDNSLNNRTVATRLANRIKGNRTPWEARADFEAKGWSYEAILQRTKCMPAGKSYRFKADGYERWLGDDKDFLARALNDTRYLSRVAVEYLRLVCPGSSTRVIPGRMTALLRDKFGLNSVLGLQGEKNRNDHRHHAVDACVIGVTDQALLQRFANASANTREAGLMRQVNDMPLPWSTYRDHVERAIGHIWVSHRPDHGFEGKMMEDTAYGIGRDGSIKQRPKADGSAGRNISSLIRICESTQLQRHGVDSQGEALPYKGYVGGSNYCIEITLGEKGKWVGDVISTFEAYKLAKPDGLASLRKPGQGRNQQPLVMRLVINDAVRLELGGRLQIMRVVKIAANGQVTMAPLHEANVSQRNSDKSDPFTYVSIVASSLQKTKARQVTISPIGELHDPGFHG